VRDGGIVKESLPYGFQKGMKGFAFNTRRLIFADIRVREALGMMFDFDWIDANFYGGLYRRSRSFFEQPAVPRSRPRPVVCAPCPGGR
jgi:peptide/nickel transport system substrate-binding protein